jgi:uncharacterized repeat protein (TIGR01451 family)
VRSKLSWCARAAAACAAIGAVLILPATAGAVTVTTLRTITVDHSGTACANISSKSTTSQTGIAFDGSSLYMSCWGDNTIVKVSPANGAQRALYHIAGGSEFGALAWDWKRNVLWACSLIPGMEQVSTQVGTIDLATSTFTPVFNAVGCDNGLAYDFTDDTLWASADVATTIEHYTTNGGFISSTPLKGTAGVNSGIAVGTNDLYLANPTTATKKIFQVARGFGSATLFATQSLRYEDMECDGETFPGKTALWAQTNRSNVVRAYQITNDTCKMPIAGADLTLDQEAAPASFPVGGQVTYTATVTNDGSADATSTTLTDTVPALSMLGAVTPSQGSCTGSGPVTCSLGTIPAGGSATVTLVATPVTNETATSTASASSPDAPAPPPVTASARATPVALVKYVKVTASAFSPSPTTLAAPGWTVQWYFTGSTPLAASDNTGMGLFDSGVRTPIDFYDFVFTAAGNYAVIDGPVGKTTTVNVPIAVSPASGSTSDSYTVTWASASPPTGFAEDVQVKAPGSSTWANLPGFDPQGTAAAFVPDHGTGTYSFRARLRNTGNGKASAYSATKTISVS